MSTVVQVPEGGYVEGYDAGLADAAAKRERAFPKLRQLGRSARMFGADHERYRVGYDDGYFDGLLRLAETVES